MGASRVRNTRAFSLLVRALPSILRTTPVAVGRDSTVQLPTSESNLYKLVSLATDDDLQRWQRVDLTGNVLQAK